MISTRIRSVLAFGLAALCFGLARPAPAQEIAEQIARTAGGVVRMSFPSRPEVCGDGEGIILRDPRTENARSMIRWQHGDDWRSRCTPGPVRVELQVRNGEVTAARAFVGGRAGTVARDLGDVSATAAVRYLLGLAAHAPAPVGEEAIVAAVLADGVDVHPELLRLAGNEATAERTREQAVFWAAERAAPTTDLTRVYASTSSRKVREQVLFAYSRRQDSAATGELLRVARSESEPTGLRKTAVFWLGQSAARAATRDLSEIVEADAADMEVREHAIFALSQRPRDEAVPALIRIARSHPSPKLRKTAIFWLGESGDPRAIALFEELLVQR